MRVLILSDTHGHSHGAQMALEAQRRAEAVVFLGDGERDFRVLMERYPDHGYYIVRGNCDFGSSSDASRTVRLEGHTIFMTHGHTYDVKYGLYRIKQAARSQKADVLLFGHTHVPMTGYEDGLYIMNPGSVSRPRAMRPSYGILDITPQGLVLNIIEL